MYRMKIILCNQWTYVKVVSMVEAHVDFSVYALLRFDVDEAMDVLMPHGSKMTSAS